MVIKRYPPSDLKSVVWFYSTELIRAKKRAWKTKEYVLQKLVTDKWNADWQFSTKKHEKIHRMCRNDLRAFVLRNYSEGFKTNKPLSGLLLYWRIMPKAERWKMNRWPRSEAWRKSMKFWGQSFSRGRYPPIYQPAVHNFISSSPPPALLHKRIIHWTKKWIYLCLQTEQMYCKFGAPNLNWICTGGQSGCKLAQLLD